MFRAHADLEKIMAGRINIISVSVALAVLLGGVSLSVFGQQRPYRLNDQQMQQLLRRIENRTDVFRSSLNQQINENGLDTPRGDRVDEFLRDFQAATVRLRDRFNNRQAVEADVQEVLNRASLIDRFMSRRH